MTYYHPTYASLENHILEHGFLSRLGLTIQQQNRGLWNDAGRVRQNYNPKADSRTLAFKSAEDALFYARGAWGESIDWKVMEIEGEYEIYPITGTQVPEGACMLLGEITPECVKRWEPMLDQVIAPAAPALRM